MIYRRVRHGLNASDSLAQYIGCSGTIEFTGKLGTVTALVTHELLTGLLGTDEVTGGLGTATMLVTHELLDRLVRHS